MKYKIKMELLWSIVKTYILKKAWYHWKGKQINSNPFLIVNQLLTILL